MGEQKKGGKMCIRSKMKKRDIEFIKKKIKEKPEGKESMRGKNKRKKKEQ